MRKHKIYYIDSHRGWFLVSCKNKREAKSEAVAEYGKGSVVEIRLATDEEIKHFLALKGEDALG